MPTKINLNIPFDEIEAPKKGERWRRRGLKIDHASPWTIAKRVIKKYTNKSFGDAFSEFCEKVPKFMQYTFLEYFQNYEAHGWRGYRGNDYIIDKNNIIRSLKDYNKYKGPYKFVSIDAEYETIYVNRITGAVWKERTDDEKKNKFRLEPWSWMNKNPKNARENWDKTVYIVKGYEMIFKSKKDPLFVRLKAEKEKIRKAMKRATKKQNIKDWDATLKFYSDKMEDKLEKSEMKAIELAKKEQAENLVKIISHGFDPLTSFRTPAKGFSGGGK